MNFRWFLAFIIFVSGCQTAKLPQAKTEDQSEAASAIHSVADALRGQSGTVKYCPVDGKRYSAHLEMCPEHQVPLKEMEE